MLVQRSIASKKSSEVGYLIKFHLHEMIERLSLPKIRPRKASFVINWWRWPSPTAQTAKLFSFMFNLMFAGFKNLYWKVEITQQSYKLVISKKKEVLFI